MENFYQHSAEEVILVRVYGSWISSQSIHPPPKASKENSLTSFQNLQPKKFTNNSRTVCTTPSIPSTLPFVDDTILHESEQNIELSAPLKGNSSPYESIFYYGYRSGSRSSIIPCRKIAKDYNISQSDWVIGTDSKTGTKYIVDFTDYDTFVRAKGCGMWLKTRQFPFPSISIQKSDSIYSSNDQIVFEIFGVSFENTSLTEMSSTSVLESNFDKVGLVMANKPLGFWIYRNLHNDNSPLFTKTVSIFETLGDIRLEAHLITGLERLLQTKYDQNFAQKVIDLISPLYQKADYNRRTTFQKVSLIRTNSLKEKLLNGSLFNFENFEISDFSECSLFEKGFVSVCDVYDRLRNFDPEFAKLVMLFGHLGFECGRVLSVVHRSGYIWGFFADQSCVFQCNAHCNNLVVLPKDVSLQNKRSLQLLAPLDFDLSYRREATVNFMKQPPSPDDELFVENFLCEFNFMASDIGGYFASDENAISGIKARPRPPGLLGDVLGIARDCAVFEFYKGYQNVKEERCAGNDISVDEMYELIGEAISLTIKENA